MRRHILYATIVAAATAAALTPAPSSSGNTLTSVLGVSSFVSLGDTIGATLWGDVDPTQASTALGPDGRWAARRDVGSLYSITARRGIQTAWSLGQTGKGVTVAVVDTGIAPVSGLAGSRKVVNGPDLSFDSQSAGARYVDGFGHGTHMAGIIAGRDPGWDPQHPDPSIFAGVAPEAQLLNMKVGAADGGVDVSQVIAAINWVVQHRRDNGMNVRVISLAYGTPTTQSWQVDPLARAVEDAWKAGIVVVAAAGNDGVTSPRLLMPAVDPWVIAVGAVDPEGTQLFADDTVADFTSGGSSTRRPDVVAPGRSIVSLRVPGSYVDAMFPGGRVLGDGDKRYFRGSGTSQATALVAGEVALLLQKRPTLTPDQVKSLLRATARPLTFPTPAMGSGDTQVVVATTAPVLAGPQKLTRSTGAGSLEASRGGVHVVDPLGGGSLEGERDILGMPWDGAAWAATSAAATAWAGGTWNGSAWTGTGFVGDSWASVPWKGRTWTGVSWRDHVTAATWDARSWRDQTWEARSWRAESWEARSWRSLG